jgi:hypothetical protein
MMRLHGEANATPAEQKVERFLEKPESIHIAGATVVLTCVVLKYGMPAKLEGSLRTEGDLVDQPIVSFIHQYRDILVAVLVVHHGADTVDGLNASLASLQRRDVPRVFRLQHVLLQFRYRHEDGNSVALVDLV